MSEQGGKDGEHAELSSSPNFDPLYNRQVNVVEGLVEFHPEFLDGLDEEDRQAMALYFFAGQEVDVDDIFQNRAELLARDPEAKAKAYRALHRFLEIAGVPEERQADLFEDEDDAEAGTGTGVPEQ